MLKTYLYLVDDQPLQLKTNCAWPFKQGKLLFLVDLGDETNKYFFVQCDQRKQVYTFYDLSAALSIPSFLFVLIPNACVAFFSDPAGAIAHGGCFFFMMFYNKSANKAVRVILRNYSIPVMWIVLYQISWSYRIANKHRRTPWIKNDWIPT